MELMGHIHDYLGHIGEKGLYYSIKNFYLLKILNKPCKQTIHVCEKCKIGKNSKDSLGIIEDNLVAENKMNNHYASIRHVATRRFFAKNFSGVNSPQEVMEVIRSKKNKDMLIYQNHIYNKDKMHENIVKWRFQDRK
ncbi:hypothetical protein ENBRE01_3258 [Enteropsectra breve]|nr:hypothetical protein ENBRE01_3258 [Enteropsectra breve]